MNNNEYLVPLQQNILFVWCCKKTFFLRDTFTNWVEDIQLCIVTNERQKEYTFLVRTRSNLSSCRLNCSLSVSPMQVKQPGLEMSTAQSELDLSYRQRYQGVTIPEAYERLILDTYDLLYAWICHFIIGLLAQLQISCIQCDASILNIKSKNMVFLHAYFSSLMLYVNMHLLLMMSGFVVLEYGVISSILFAEMSWR